MKLEFKETTIIDNYVSEMAIRGMSGLKDISQMIVEASLKSTAVFLKRMRRNDPVVALIVDEPGEEESLVAILTYHEADGEGQANYTFELSFSRNDIPEDAVLYQVNDNSFYAVAAQVGLSLHGLIYNSPTNISLLYHVMMKTIKDWLKDNAKKEEETTLILPGYFTAISIIENDEAILSITPDGQLTRTIKDDASLEI